MDELSTLNRRELLKTTTGMLTGLVVAGSPLALLARGPVWAVDLKALTSSEGTTLMAVARTISPHDKLDDAAYALVIQAIDGDASKEENTRKLIKDGIASLGPGFAASTENDRVEALRKIESSAFFQFLRQKTVQVLYATPMAYAYFGYEGEAFSKGGYLLRGFNDLRWLPEVPWEDSGPMPVSAQLAEN
ncbi:MAG: tat (twin-arginine translocation) pathway signal sequence [Candidatus Acidiferrales bacterium]